MKNGKRMKNGTPGEAEGARRATGDSPGGAAAVGPLAPGQRWSAGTGPCRSPIPEQADHGFRSKPITDSGASRSLNA